ncbi:hypothetical protein A2482_01625 [Candidatus Falkowbacteria bacterium RIFOXYC2_FULL_48_21]|uniref:Glutamate racemase n=1 Tax=Candidatus Falkowbacteria bacterium RIFOXYC2_FULL_48_21 TaxID=1798005 RepID=A0A1F5TGE3_9BACT|nr:MAG: hypothetical protein A2482_01625 [Candidatus Falkowbacteria bacterium RIFOXYC2_FULL_48_21]
MIGVFDSGLGGLTVLKEIIKVLPEYDYMYLGDTLHVPYGNRSDKAIYDLTKNACDYLFDHGCTLIIIACNTATAKALRKLQQEYLPSLTLDLPRAPTPTHVNILGVIRPVAEEIARLNKQRIGVIGTRGTVNSEAYVVELEGQRAKVKGQKKGQNINSKIKNLQTGERELQIFQQASPLLVPMIEEGWMKRREMKSVLRYYLRPLKAAQVETLILGCTHYPLLLKQIRSMMGKKCFVPSPGEIVAGSLKDYLARHPEMAITLTKNKTRRYLVTDLNDNFQKTAERFLGERIELEEAVV